MGWFQNVLTKDPNTSEAGIEYLMQVVDKACRFSSRARSHETRLIPVTRLLVDLCLTLVVPSFIRDDRGGEFTATVMENL